jgi:hypothetical protein
LVAIEHKELDDLHKVADDKDEKIEKRFDAISTIFQKHVPKNADLESLSKALGRARWVDSSNVTEVGLIFGWVPVDFGTSLSKHPVFLVEVLSREKVEDYPIWFSSEEPVGLSEFVSALKGDFREDKTRKIKLRDCAVCRIEGKVTLNVLYHMRETRPEKARVSGEGQSVRHRFFFPFFPKTENGLAGAEQAHGEKKR